MARIVTKIGDIFAVRLGDTNCKYFQYVANDLTQLNSSIIRVFKQKYDLQIKTDLSDVVKGEVDFHAHCVLKWGIQLELWQKVGKSAVVGDVDVLFRGTNDYGRKLDEPPVLVSENWYVWKINENFRSIGKLTEEYKETEIGLVINPKSIVHRVRTGNYDFDYPN